MNTDEHAIRALVAEWLAASQRGDLDKVLGLMTDDAIFLVAGQSPMSKHDFAEASRAQAQGGSPRLEFESEILEIETHGDWAYLRQHLKVVMTPADGSPAVKHAGHILTLFKKQSGKWLLARDANLLTRLVE